MKDQHAAIPAPQIVSALRSRQSCLQSHPPLTLLRHIPAKTPLPGSGIPSTTRDQQCSQGRGDDSRAESALDPQPDDWRAQQSQRRRQCLHAPSALPGPQMGRQSTPNLRKAGQKSGTHLLPRSARSKGLGPGKRVERSVVLRWLLEREMGGASHQQGIWAERVPANIGQG